MSAATSCLRCATRATGWRWSTTCRRATGTPCPPRSRWCGADAADTGAVRAAIERYGVGAAVHAAAALDDTPEAAARNRRTCAGFVRACAGAGVRRLVLTSSAAIYGAGPECAIAEARAPAPERPYGIGKLACEAAVREGFGAPGSGYVVLRCFNVAGADAAGRAGPRGGEALVEAACAAALGARGRLRIFGTDYPTRDGTCVRDYVHVADVARAHAAALGALERGLGAATLNCGGGQGHSVREVLAEVAARAGAAPPAEDGPRPPRRCGGLDRRDRPGRRGARLAPAPWRARRHRGLRPGMDAAPA